MSTANMRRTAYAVCASLAVLSSLLSVSENAGWTGDADNIAASTPTATLHLLNAGLLDDERQDK